MFTRNLNVQIPFLDVLGIPFLVLDVCNDTRLYFSLDRIEKLIEETGMCSEDASRLRDMAREQGLFTNKDPVIERIEKFNLADQPWALNFKLCDCARKPKHGYIISPETNFMLQTMPPVTFLVQGFCFIYQIREQQLECNSDVCIHLLKQMVEAGLDYSDC